MDQNSKTYLDGLKFLWGVDWMEENPVPAELLRNARLLQV